MTADSKAFEMSAEEDAALAAQAEPDAPEEENEGEDTGEPEDAAAEAPEATQQAGKPKTVPHKALHAEREEHKKTKTALEQERIQRAADMARLEERVKAMQERFAPPETKEDPDPEPDGNKYPLDWIDWQSRQNAATKARQAEQAQLREQQQQIEAFTADYREAAEEYSRQNPDFREAYDFLVQSRMTELQMLGLDRRSAQKALHQEEMAIALSAMQNRENPGERLIKLAQHRGWTKAAPVADDDAGAEAAAELDRIASGQKGGKSLSQAGGSAGGAEMTAERLLKMDNDEFDAWMSKHPAQAKRIMGG